MNKVYLDPEIYYIENFIEKEHIDLFLEDFKNSDNWYEEGNFYIKKNEHCSLKTKMIVDLYKNKVADLINDDFNSINWNNNLQKYIATDKEWAIAPHADRFNAEGIDYASIDSMHVTKGYILYFNDDYTGGEVVYINKNIEIRPKPGMIIVHSGLDDYKHAVKTVKSGERYILSGFVYENDYYKNTMTVGWQ